MLFSQQYLFFSLLILDLMTLSMFLSLIIFLNISFNCVETSWFELITNPNFLSYTILPNSVLTSAIIGVCNDVFKTYLALIQWQFWDIPHM